MKFYIGSGFKNVDNVNYISNELKKYGHIHTYNWALDETLDETKEEMINFSILELKAIDESDVVIILLPAGRGTHIELGYALHAGKKIYLCVRDEDEFSLSNTVNFYQIPEIEKIVGDNEKIVRRLVKWSIYEEGRYAYILEDIEVLDKLVTTKGHLGIWNY